MRESAAAWRSPDDAVLRQVVEAVAFDRDGLVPAIAQQHDNGKVLMVAWMNREALEETLRTGWACYWSRSRGRLWRKGETSGHHQRVLEFRLDCDGDTVLLRIDQTGVACHTGRPTCFFRRLGPQGLEIDEPVVVPPAGGA
jgi:phosphoribosyl-AMP cyclohydrolase